MKKCTKCKIEKDLSEFYKRRKSKDGFLSHCKSCEKEYCGSRKEKIKISNSIYYGKNKSKIISHNKKWSNSNKEKLKKYFKERYNKKRKTEPLFKLKCNLRNRIWYAFKNKGFKKDARTIDFLGVDWITVKKHIERQFTKGMNWNNYGEWHIDHIIPFSSANTEEEIKQLCHYSNLQPMWAVDNLSKSDSINGQQTLLRI